MATAPCPCGGETQVEYFIPPKHAIEWFLRCTKCERMSVPAASYKEAEQLQIIEEATQ